MTCVSECGIKTIETNAITNAKFESKQLRMSETKSVKIHVSKEKEKECQIKAFVHEKKMRENYKVWYLGDKLSNMGGSSTDCAKVNG